MSAPPLHLNPGDELRLQSVVEEVEAVHTIAHADEMSSRYMYVRVYMCVRTFVCVRIHEPKRISHDHDHTLIMYMV